MTRDWRTDPLLVALPCMALEPGLSGLLLLDATAETAVESARLLADLRLRRTKERPRVAILSSTAGEEDIWGVPRPANHGAAESLRRRGLLSPHDGGERIVVIPDLARISLAGARAIVTHATAEVGVLERDGESATWRPSVYWIGTLARSRVGEVSPHLLDRFSLRVSTPASPAAADSTDLLTWAMADDHSATKITTSLRLPDELLGRLSAAPASPPEIPTNVLHRILSYFPAFETPGIRRPLALARFARAWAHLGRQPRVTAGHVAWTARVAGLAPPNFADTHIIEEPWPASSYNNPSTSGEFDPGRAAMSPSSDARPAEPLELSDAQQDDTWVSEPSEEHVFPTAATATTPYLEDITPTAREAFSLQLPSMSGRNSESTSGVPIGTRPVHDLRDISLVSTVLEAARFRHIRTHTAGDPGRIHVTRADLRGYRRVPPPHQVLALVVDYTSLNNTRWQDALLPFLEWGYVTRASVLFVQVGARSAPEPLRATQIAARNLLSPRIHAALEEQPGVATPLAHGLELALRSLRRTFTHGRARSRGGILVVVTDGRGNVPLEASLANAHRGHVLRRGVEDAITVARALAELKELLSVVLHPSPQQYPLLPLELAKAMGATSYAIEIVQPAVAPG